MKFEEIKKDGKILAVIIRSTESEKMLEFPTPNEFPLQIGIHHRPKGAYVKAHEHVPFKNISIASQEIFFVENGKMKVGIYDGKEKYCDVTVNAKEIILLNCGHSIFFEENTKAIEVKQGPYRQKEFEKVPLE